MVSCRRHDQRFVVKVIGGRASRDSEGISRPLNVLGHCGIREVPDETRQLLINNFGTCDPAVSAAQDRRDACTTIQFGAIPKKGGLHREVHTFNKPATSGRRYADMPVVVATLNCFGADVQELC